MKNNTQMQFYIVKEQEIEQKIIIKSEELNSINHKIRIANEQYEMVTRQIKDNSCLELEIENKTKILNLLDSKARIKEEELDESNNSLNSIKKIVEEYQMQLNEIKFSHKKIEEEIRHFEKLTVIKKEELADLERLVMSKVTSKDEISQVISQRQKELYSVENQLAEKQVWAEKFQEAIEKLISDMEDFTCKYENEKLEKLLEIQDLQNHIDSLMKKKKHLSKKITMYAHQSLQNQSNANDQSRLQSVKGDVRSMKRMVVNQSHIDKPFTWSPDNCNCKTMRDTDEKYDNDANSRFQIISSTKYQESEPSEIDKKRVHKPKSSMANPLNPYINHIRASSSGGGFRHQRRVSEPLSLLQFNQSQH